MTLLVVMVRLPKDRGNARMEQVSRVPEASAALEEGGHAKKRGKCSAGLGGRCRRMRTSAQSRWRVGDKC